MSTQGIVSIVALDGKTLIKAIAGDNGFRAPELAERIREERLTTAEQVYKAAQELRFGCDDCLIVMDEQGEEGHERALEELHERYRITFSTPWFNPRWARGTADYIELVDISDLANETSSD